MVEDYTISKPIISIGVVSLLVVSGIYLLMEDDGPNWRYPEGPYWDGLSSNSNGFGWYFESDGSVHYVTSEAAEPCENHWMADFSVLIREDGTVCHWESVDGSLEWNKDKPFFWSSQSTFEVCWIPSDQSDSECSLVIVGTHSNFIILADPGFRCLVDDEGADVSYSQIDDGIVDCDNGIDESVERLSYTEGYYTEAWNLYYVAATRASPDDVICDLYVEGDPPENTQHEDIYDQWMNEFYFPTYLPILPNGCTSLSIDL